jgi:hypothetical protein
MRSTSLSISNVEKSVIKSYLVTKTMKLRLLLLMMVLCFLLPKTYAVTTPANPGAPVSSAGSISNARLLSLSAKEIQHLTGHKMNLIERLQWKILQKKFKKPQEKEKTSKNTLSLVALIAGIAGLGLIFFLPIAGFVLLLTAIVTGIVARNSTEDPKSRKNALIGLVLGLVGIGLVIIALIAWAAVGVY